MRTGEGDSTQRLKEYIARLPQVADLDNSFEVRWSLSELENIVYDFINSNELPKEFSEPIPGSKHQQESPFKDVSKEDLMKVVQLGKSGGSSDKEPLPNLIREYILHDRGNSLFLGKSFGNLPSPVQEDATIKKLFKFNEDEKEQPQRNESRNQQIRIEGKEKPAPEKQHAAQNKAFNIDIKELNRFVFNDAPDGSAVDDAYA